MGRPRIHATNAERQKAYRERKRPPADLRLPEHFDLPRETDGRHWTLRSFVWEVVNQGVSVGFVAERLEVSRQVIRACLMLTPNALPKTTAPGTEKSVTKPAWLPRFYADSWCEWYIEVSRRGRPRQWYDDRSRKRAWWMRKVAVRHHHIGFWADEAERIDQERRRRVLTVHGLRETRRATRDARGRMKLHRRTTPDDPKGLWFVPNGRAAGPPRTAGSARVDFQGEGRPAPNAGARARPNV